MLQLLSNFHLIFSIADVYKYVENWNKKQAYKIIKILHNIFDDFEIQVDVKSDINYTDEESDAELQWKEITDSEESCEESLASANDSFLHSTLKESDECMNSSFIANTVEKMINNAK